MAFTNPIILANGRLVPGEVSPKHPASPSYPIFGRILERNRLYVLDQVFHTTVGFKSLLTVAQIECDKSFTRSDALAKHMRIQHNITPPAPGRGGNRKRKREEPEPVAQTADGYATFKVDPPDIGDFEDRLSPSDILPDHLNGTLSRRSASPDGDGDNEDDEDDIPAYLKAREDPATGLIMGRSPAMVKYLLLKAKYKYVIDEHASLIQELRTARHEEQCWKDRKDALLDEVLRVTFGYVSRLQVYQH